MTYRVTIMAGIITFCLGIPLSASGQTPPSSPSPPSPMPIIALRSLPLGASLLSHHNGPPLCPLDGKCWSPGDFRLSPSLSKSTKLILFRWYITKVPNAQGVIWQVASRNFPPFSPDTAIAPPGLIASRFVVGKSGEFTLNVPALAASVKRQRRAKLPAHLGEVFYVRVVPLQSPITKQVSGRPSNVIRITYGDPPKQDLPFKIVHNVTVKEGPPLLLTRFEWVRARYIKNWPPGCTPSSDQDKGILENFVSAGEGAWNWASGRYAKAKGLVVTELVSAFQFTGLPIPRSVIEVAVDGALMAAGIPPNIPNLDELMNEGADYLAGQLVEQIPVPPEVTKGVTGPAAEYAIDQFKHKAQTQAKAQLVSAAKQVHSGSEGSGKTCEGRYDFPYLKLTIRNTGNTRGTNVPFSVSDGKLIFMYLGSTIAEIQPGQELTIPVYLFSKDRMNVPNDRKCTVNPMECNLNLWWKKFQYTPFQFTVTASQKTQCIEEGVPGHTNVHCSPVMTTLYQTPIQDWSLVYDKGFVGP